MINSGIDIIYFLAIFYPSIFYQSIYLSSIYKYVNLSLHLHVSHTPTPTDTKHETLLLMNKHKSGFKTLQQDKTLNKKYPAIYIHRSCRKLKNIKNISTPRAK